VNRALRLLVRHALRVNRRGIIGLALVVALAGGVALTSLASARRTASAFPRYLVASNASDVALNPIADGADPEDPPVAELLRFTKRAHGLPQVAADATYVGLENLYLIDDDGLPLDGQPEVVGSLDGRFIDQDQMAILEGRVPATDRADEVAVNRQAARLLHLHLGSKVHLAVPDLSGGDEVDPREVPILDRQEARVVGIGLFPEEVLSDDFDGSARLLAAPALTSRVRDIAGSYIWQGLRLRPGTSVDEGIEAYRSILDDGYKVNIQRTDTQVERVQRSVRPVAVALGAFGAAAALATLALGGLGAVRLLGESADADSRVLRALGVSRPERLIVAAAAPVVAVVAGTVGAIAIAVLLSPLSPIGAVREVEPNRGVDLDVTVLFLGGAALALLLAGTAVVAARRAVQASVRGSTAAPRPSWLVGVMATVGLGPVAVVGAGHALGGEGRRDGVPTRSTLAACIVSVVALASALTFGASVRSLLATPPSYGWAADLAVHSGGGYDELNLDGAEAAATTKGIEGLTMAGFGSLSLDGHAINGMGFEAIEGPPLLTVVDGRLPTKAAEVALGADTARDLEVTVDDDVDAGSDSLHVVGVVALPAIGPAASAHPSLGQGALMTLDGLIEADENAYPSLALIRVAHGVDLDRAARGITIGIETTMTDLPPDFAESYRGLRPSEVIGLGPASRTVNLLAGLLGAASVLALALTLGSSVRRRRHTYAVLAALGFDRRTLRQTVRWQLNLLTVLALAIGLPIGVVAGRVAWMAFADQLGAAADPRVPIAVLSVVTAGLLAMTNLVGEWPARSAGRRRVIEALRD
jgi:putative ABC transport system permease protein